MAKIGVEQSLTDVKDALQSRGYQVTELARAEDARGCDCCVITGLDQNMMGIQNIAVDGPVINAHGLTAEQVCREVESRIQ
ncbi:YkuS family protein [Aneurinibacillus sp. Ricciae_BoGa-3]|uniref:YkuS family protein n=1 Tax=Aneurinibacillus sp. Ricciae_BoGa-3 TaxID=3022697 RepID=UPI002340E724|nr:YkuS family protein [Aneurinibacillus sp. Ricciae_BoGa-3]WCK53575.1 YkuS family protein [Aneurinibacillus sp. Ricciae_BoGa-3]